MTSVNFSSNVRRSKTVFVRKLGKYENPHTEFDVITLQLVTVSGIRRLHCVA